MFPSPNSSSSSLLAPFPFLSDFTNCHSSPNFPLDFFSSIFHQQPSSLNMDLQQPHITTSMADDVIKPKKQAAAPRKRTSKKDRHSKIYTAKGPRDRRMRLSLDVARKFFDLQDMLGFDKASGTVEWLLNQSESSIDQLKKTLIGKDCKLLATGSSSSLSITNSDCDIFDGSTLNSGLLSNYNCRAKIDVRESRKMARARAKERTKEKMYWIQSLKSTSNNNGSKAAPAHQGSTVVEEPELGQSLLISYNMSMELADTRQQQQQQQQLGLEDHVVVSDDAIAGHTQEHLYTDLQLLTKPWEAFNNAPPTYLC